MKVLSKGLRKYEIVSSVTSLFRAWLGIGDRDRGSDNRALGELLTALEALPPAQARYLAQFAYLLGRVAHADQHVSPEETRTMERLIEREGQLPPEQAALVVQLAQRSNLLFGGTDNFLVAREFAGEATGAQKLALVGCLFGVSVAEGSMSIAEEQEIRRIARELRIEHPELVRLRLEHQQHLPGRARRGPE